MKKELFLIVMGVSMLVSCKTPVPSSSASKQPSQTESSNLPMESAGGLEGMYHTKSVKGTIKLTDDKNKSGLYFYCTDTAYTGYHSLTNVDVYKAGKLVNKSELKGNESATAEFITGIGKENGTLDLSVGDLYKVTIN